MGVIQAFKMAVKSIASNKVRTVLTMLGIIIGVAAVMVLVSLVQGYTSSMMEYYQRQGANRIEVYAYQWGGADISSDLYDYCLGLGDLVLGVTPNAQTGGVVKYGAKKLENANIFLGSDQYAVCNNYTIAKGRDMTYLDVKKYQKVCVLGAVAADDLFDFADPIGKQITISGEPFTVVGVFEAKYPSTGGNEEQDWMSHYYDSIVVVPYTDARFMSNSYITFDSYVVKAASSAATTEAVTKLASFLSTKIDPNKGYYDVYSINQQIEAGNEETRMLSMILGGIAGIALLVGGIGIMNIMLVTVTERTREIGIRKALGARRRSIIIQFLIESGVISFVGGIIGILLGLLITLVLGKLMWDMTIFPSVSLSLGAAAFSIVLGIIFGIYPAAKASGLQPVDALRAE